MSPTNPKSPTVLEPVLEPASSRHVVEVSFEGDGAGIGALNWGQQHILGAIRNLGSPMNMCAVRELAPTPPFRTSPMSCAST